MCTLYSHSVHNLIFRCLYMYWLCDNVVCLLLFTVESIFEGVNAEADKKDSKDRRQRKMSSSKLTKCNSMTTYTNCNGPFQDLSLTLSLPPSPPPPHTHAQITLQMPLSVTLFFKAVAISSTRQLVSSPAGRRSTSSSTLTDWSGLTVYRYCCKFYVRAIDSPFCKIRSQSSYPFKYRIAINFQGRKLLRIRRK